MIRSQLKRLLNSTAVYGIGGILTRFISFFLLPVYTSYLTPDDYGIISIIGLLTLCTFPVFSLGFGTSLGICYFDHKDTPGKEKTIWTSIVILVFSTTILVLLGWWFGPQISWLSLQDTKYADLILISFLATAASILYTPLRSYLQFEERAKLYVTLTIISSLITIGFSILMVVYFAGGAAGMIKANLYGQTATLVLISIVVGRKVKFRFDMKECNKLLKLGIPLVPAFFCLFIIQQSNKYTLMWLSGLHSVGIYSVGFNIGYTMNLLVNGFTAAWYPYFMSFVDKQDEASPLFGRIFTYYTMVFGALTACYFIFARPVVLLLTKTPFHDCYYMVGLTAASNLFLGMFTLLLPGIYFAKDVKFITVIQLIAAVLVIILNFLLIWLWDFQGAAWALMLGNTLLCLLQYLWNRRCRKHYFTPHYETRRILKLAGLLLVLALVSLMPRGLSLLHESFLALFLFFTLVAGSFAIMNPAEKNYLFTWLKKSFKQEAASSVPERADI